MFVYSEKVPEGNLIQNVLISVCKRMIKVVRQIKYIIVTPYLIVPIFFTTVRGKVPSSTMLLRSKVITNLMKFFKLEKSTVNLNEQSICPFVVKTFDNLVDYSKEATI